MLEWNHPNLNRGNGYPLSIIRTDLVEAESLVHAMASREAMHNPHNFAGKEPCVYFKLPYVAPCDKFGELRWLILRVGEKTGLRANFKGIVAIEATEWLGHEREEYFTILLKYLSDHRDIWQSAIVLNNCTDAQLQRFLSACVKIMKPQVVDALLFSNRGRLENTIIQAFAQQGRRIQTDAVHQLACALARPELKESRSLSLIDRVAEDFAAVPDGKEITTTLVEEYLGSTSAILTMLAGRPLAENWRQTYEK